MEIIPAKADEISAIKKLLKECKLPIDDIAFEQQHFWISKYNNELIAVCGLEIMNELALLRSLAVKNLKRNSGLGTAIYEHTIEQARKIYNIHTLFLLTTTASNFFQKHGWKFIDRNNVPNPVQQTNEFKFICPKSAQCMKLEI